LVLVIVLALLVGLYVWLRPHMTETPDGVVVELPWSWSETSAVETPTAEPTTEPAATEPLETSEPSPEPLTAANSAIHAVEVTTEELLNGTAKARMEAVGGNALVLTMKDEKGQLAYVSSLELAQELKSSGGDPAVNLAIQKLHEEGVYLVARMECFRDELIPYYDTSMALRTHSGYRWSDPEKIHWVDPTNETVRGYWKDVAVELAGLGFDEIVLVNAAYPTEGHLEYLQEGDSYPINQENGLEQVLRQLYSELSTALAGTEAKLSVESRESALINSEGDDSGQTAALLATYAWRVWVETEEANTAELNRTLVQAGMDQAGQGLVRMSAQDISSGEDESWALLSAA
jgi:hypothetical protein